MALVTHVSESPAACCQLCVATAPKTYVCCVKCQLIMCLPCSGYTFEPPAPFVLCASCRAGSLAGHEIPLDEDQARKRRAILRGLTLSYHTVLKHVKRAGTRTSQRNGVNQFLKFGEAMQMDVLPCPTSRYLLIAYAMYCLAWRDLDTSTINGHLVAVGGWHDYVHQVFQRAFPDTVVHFHNPLHNEEVQEMLTSLGENYKKKSRARVALTIAQARAMFDRGFKNTPSGDHNKLAVALSLLGMLRQKAATSLIVRYRIHVGPAGEQTVEFLEGTDVYVVRDTDLGDHIAINVDVDKNVNALKRRQGFIPDEVPALGLYPVAMLIRYIIKYRPPSGGFLLAAPRSAKMKTFRSNRFTGLSNAVKRAFTAVFPLDATVELIGSHSGRKSLAQWLWNAGNCRRVIADAGGWFMKRDAVDLYFKTAPKMILHAVRYVGMMAPRGPLVF
jgi:hypothetical protein